MILLSRSVVSSGGSFAEFCEGLLKVDSMSFQISVEVCFHPRSKTVANEGHVILIT